MKRMKAFACGLVAACILAAPLIGTPSMYGYAEETTQTLNDFNEDFESYEVGKFVEEEATFADKWTNNLLAGGEAQGMDAHLQGIAKVEYENGNSGNKVLRCNNASVAMNTFFHIDPGNDFRVKNFTAGFKLKFKVENAGERGWVGLSFRKKATSHYTGTNNLMFTVERYTASTQIAPFSYACFNGNTPSHFGDAGVQELFKDKLTYTSSVYTVPGATANEDTPWMDFRVEVNGNRYKTFLDDVNIADCTFDVPSFDYFGYMSLNCCTADIQVDDFYVTVQDSELPPVIEKLATPVVTLDEAAKKITWEEVAGANLYSVSVNGEVVKTTGKEYYELKDLKEAGEYSIVVKALSADLFEAYSSDESTPVVYKVGGDKKGGCGSALSFGALPLLVGGALVVAQKKRKNIS